LQWHYGRRAAAQARDHSIGILFVKAAPYEVRQGTTLAAARPYDKGTTIRVFQDRIALELAPLQRYGRERMLRHILAHEIVHVLEGISRHSETGLMKANWTSQDIREITGAGLHPAPEDRSLLQVRFENAGDRMGA
jgi:hypothetical protein